MIEHAHLRRDVIFSSAARFRKELVMPEATDLAEIARAIADQAEKLDRARSVLGERPEQVAELVDPLIGMLDRVIDAARDAF